MFQIVINIKATVPLRGGQVAEYELRSALPGGLFPDPVHIPGADRDLSLRIVRRQRVDEPHVQRQLPPVVGDAQHVVHLGIYAARPDVLGALGQPLYHFLLDFGGFYDLRVEVGLRHRQL